MIGYVITIDAMPEVPITFSMREWNEAVEEFDLWTGYRFDSLNADSIIWIALHGFRGVGANLQLWKPSEQPLAPAGCPVSQERAGEPIHPAPPPGASAL